MEDVAPLLKLVWLFKQELEKGRSTKNALQSVFEAGVEPREVSLFLIELSKPRVSEDFYASLNSQIRKSFYKLLEKGSRGEPMTEKLGELEAEIIVLCEEQIDDHIQKLPYLMVFPIFILQVPAFLLLLFGPILNSFLESVAKF